jgi:hypothetical protein
LHPIDDDALRAYPTVDGVTGEAVLRVVTYDPVDPRRGVPAVTPDRDCRATTGAQGQARGAALMHSSSNANQRSIAAMDRIVQVPKDPP